MKKTSWIFSVGAYQSELDRFEDEKVKTRNSGLISLTMNVCSINNQELQEFVFSFLFVCSFIISFSSLMT